MICSDGRFELFETASSWELRLLHTDTEVRVEPPSSMVVAEGIENTHKQREHLLGCHAMAYSFGFGSYDKSKAWRPPQFLNILLNILGVGLTAVCTAVRYIFHPGFPAQRLNCFNPLRRA
jgi:hypothetical protein